MLQRFEITGVHSTVDDNLRKYITKKLGHLDRYLSRQSRQSAHLEVRLKEAKQNGRKQSICEATLHLPQETINITESTINMYAAVDIIQTKLKQRIKKYKDSRTDGKSRRRLFARFRNAPI